MRQDPAHRTTGLLATATTLVALAALAASAPAMHGLPAARAGIPSSFDDSDPVRAVAAVVAAAARDLLTPSTTLGLALRPLDEVTCIETAEARADATARHRVPSIRHLPDRLLDLPPPAC